MDLGHATRRMHHHLGLKRARLARSQSPDNQLSGALFDPYRFGSEMNVNAKDREFAQPTDQRRLSLCGFLVSTSKDDDENHNRGGLQRDNSNYFPLSDL
jgi:hypothetical protein